MSAQFKIEFVPSGRGKARCEPNPLFPDGVHIRADLKGAASCTVTLPYPAPECGFHHVLCNRCKTSVAITAAGRPDDPRSAMIPCATDKGAAPNLAGLTAGWKPGDYPD